MQKAGAPALSPAFCPAEPISSPPASPNALLLDPITNGHILIAYRIAGHEADDLCCPPSSCRRMCWQHLTLQLGLTAAFVLDGSRAARHSDGDCKTQLWPCSALLLDVACDRALAFAACERVRMLIGCCAE
eukprot:CAMPEP_0115851596 /NCGR_PEP_ID=MMETSP0287-20121206/12564_1 /TAXON_ID=412157 /ORGANISM="Chrysochromulina rotalis, Strain UIO044" /LENGTH=130 /DNA_ID=CAMNT_0003305635 /DNA_START=52 /DNA_END=441 /DNA_ORIENTATION=+